MLDVIVIGGGPAGGYTACKLAEKGHSVMVLERKHRLGEPVCCTGIVGQECVSAFAVEDKVILRRVNSARLFPPSGNHLHVRREKPQASVLDMAAFHMMMADRARGAGVEYILDSPVKNIAIERDKAGIHATSGGEDTYFAARAVVIACGFGSGICQRLGLGRPGDFTVGAETEVKTVTDEVEVYFGEVAPGFFAWVVPTEPSMARVGLMSRRNPGIYLRKWLAQLAAGGKISLDGALIKYGGIPLRPLPRTFGERLLVVGDAAGQVKPTSGGGIYYGLLCADIAAKVLHQALENDDLSAKALKLYEREWRKKLGTELKIGYWTRKLFERLSDRQIDRIFEMVKARGIDKMLLEADELSFDWHSKVIKALLKHQVITGALDLIRLPFRL